MRHILWLHAIYVNGLNVDIDPMSFHRTVNRNHKKVHARRHRHPSSSLRHLHPNSIFFSKMK